MFVDLSGDAPGNAGAGSALVAAPPPTEWRAPFAEKSGHNSAKELWLRSELERCTPQHSEPPLHRPKSQIRQVGLWAGLSGFPVHITPMCTSSNENFPGSFLNGRQDSVVAHAIFPKFSEAEALESFTDAVRVVQQCNALVQESKNGPCHLRIKPAEFPTCGEVKLNAPYHVLS